MLNVVADLKLDVTDASHASQPGLVYSGPASAYDILK